MRAKNISRYTYKKTAFQGWRLAITRKGHTFVKYFGDRHFEGYRAAFKAAVEVRDAILYELAQPGANPEVIFRAAHEWLHGSENEEGES